MKNEAAYLLGVICAIAQEHSKKCKCLACKINRLTEENLSYIDVINPFELVAAAKKLRYSKNA